MNSLPPLPGLAFLAATVCCGQGNFQNLDFESAQLPLGVISGFSTNVAAAVPNWSVYYGAQPAAEVLYHDIGLGSTILLVIDRGYFGAFRTINGNFSVVLQANAIADLTLAQSGTVPTGSQSFRFSTQGTIPQGWMEVVFGGNQLALQLLESRPNNINVYGSDISAFQGQFGELRIVAHGVRPFGMWSYSLDDLLFSPVPVPEPSLLGLLLLGAGLFGLHWRKAKP